MKISAKMRKQGVLYPNLNDNNSLSIRQLMRVSGVITFLLLVTIELLLATPSKGQDMATEMVTVGLRNEALTTGLKKIEQQTAFRFFYRRADIKQLRSLNVLVNTRTVNETLNEMLQNTFLSFHQLDGHILLQRTHQNSYEINGRVLDKNRQSIQFATVSIEKMGTNKNFQSTQTDSSGYFKLIVQEKGEYLINISAVRMVDLSMALNLSDIKVVKLPDIVLVTSSNELKQVTIVVKKPFIEFELDKMIVNVKNSIVADGGTVEEILEKVPGVLIDGDGKIALMGKAGVTILINGRPTHLSADDLSNRLKAMQSNSLEKIEVMTNPSSKYDAAGNAGIINLVLKKNDNFGVNGSVTSALSYGMYPKYNGSTTLNFRNKKINIYGGYSYLNSLLGRHFDVDRDDELTILKTTNFTKSQLNNHAINGGIDYYANERTLIGFFASAFSDQSNSIMGNKTVIGNNISIIDSGSVMQDTSERNSNNFALNFNFKRTFKRAGEELSADLDFTNFDKKAFSDVGAVFFYTEGGKSRVPLLLESQMPSILKIRSFKVDYNLPFNSKFKSEMGVKSSYVFSDNNALFNVLNNDKWEVDKGKTNHFKNGEHINAAYFTVSGKFKKVFVKIGVRGEQTSSTGKSPTLNSEVKHSYFDIFPTLFITRDFSNDQKLNISYSRRIGRPNYKDLNPFTNFIDNYTYYYGNPYLNPEYSHSVNLNYSYKSSLVAFFNYTRTTDVLSYIYAVEIQADSSKIWAGSMGNLNASNNYSLNLNSPAKIFSWWNSSNNVLVFYNDYNSDYNGGYLNNRKIIINLSSVHTFTLPKNFKCEISGRYKSPSLYGFHVVKPQSSINIGLQKSFLDKKARISLTVNDLLNTMQWSSNMYFRDIHVQYYNKAETRIYRASLTYQFGKNTIKAARQRKDAVEDEKKRVEH